MALVVPRHLCRVSAIFTQACRITGCIIHRAMNVALHSGTRRTATFMSRLCRLHPSLQNHGMYHTSRHECRVTSWLLVVSRYLCRVSAIFTQACRIMACIVHRDMNVALHHGTRRIVTFMSRLSHFHPSMQNHGTYHTSRHECRGTLWASVLQHNSYAAVPGCVVFPEDFL